MVNIAILGFGVVGSGVYEMIKNNKAVLTETCGCEINVRYVLDIRDFSSHPEAEKFTKNIKDILDDPDVSVVVEAMGGSHPAYEYTMDCLNAKKSVVTSNKEVVATFGKTFLSCANQNGVSYLYEASVGGGIPVLHPLLKCLSGNEIVKAYGILNGTTNYILTQMFKNQKSYESALREAQEKGYAERDPRADVEGIDTCRKICIISDIAFGGFVDPDAVHTEGITAVSGEDVSYAESRSCSIKLLGYTKKREDGIVVIVAPFMVSKDFILSNVDDVYNAVTIHGNAVEDVTFCGRGAGKFPTASAMVGDIIDIVNNTAGKNREFGRKDVKVVDYKSEPFSFYLKLSGSCAGIEKVFENCKVLSASDSSAVIITDKTTQSQVEDKVKNASLKIERLIRCL
ncbi:MAG: homoserine dehydrogenase [Clostridia bacterium]|nr:homoserine dehydrogenase [Clostridia bacterium]